ncbi:MAG: SCP2 sterol-binding domain-containing protein [Actinomycetota bacterium]
MPRFLSPEWLEHQRSLASALPVRPGATARLQVVVTGGPDGDVIYTQVIEDGQLVASTLGPDDSADVTLTQTYPDAVAIAKGELDANAAFMQGRVKVVGNMGALMAVMPLTQSTDYKDLVAALAADTDF